MKKKLLPFFLLISLLVFCTAESYAQEINLKGKVLSGNDKLPLPGASVVLKGSLSGTMTDENGDFSIKVPAGAALRVSFTGYTTAEISPGSRTFLEVSLEEDVSMLSEVVVTALGITREKRALGYSVQELGGKQITEARETNLLNALSGKISGVQVTSSSGTPGGSSRLVIRGASSIGSNNQPLFVVDGVPIDNGNYGSSTGVDYGNGAGAINPDDVESINVLKGPSAAALYGSRGANGVVVITTKSGKGSKGIGVSVNSNTTFERPLRLPEWQNEYGQGAAGEFSYVDGRGGGINDGVDESWGPRLDGRLIPQYNSPIVNGVRQATPWIARPDNVKSFFELGKTFTNNFSVTGGNESGDFRLSFTNLDQEGILPNTDYYRRTVSLNAGWNLTPKLNIRATGNYVLDGSDNRQALGLQFIWFGRQVDVEDLRDFYTPGTIYHRNWNDNYFTNPYYQMNLSTRENQKDRLYGNITATYKFTDWLQLMARTGTDFYQDRRKTKNAARLPRLGSATLYDSYNEQQVFVRESNSDFLFNANKSFGSWDVTANLGGNHRSNFYQTNYMGATELAIPRVWNMGNSRQRPVTTNYWSEKVINSLYASANLGYKNYLFIDLTARNDWSSALPKGNNSYFYPSVAVSGVLTDMFNIKSKVLSFAKIRAGYALVGNDTDAYNLINTYDYKDAWGTTPTLAEPNGMLNAALKPEITTSFELGAELKFWGNRAGLDVTYYSQESSDQILNVNVSTATGYTSKLLNAGMLTNKGVEVQLNVKPVVTGSFSWEIGLNWARNRNKVVELAEGLDTYQINQGINIRGMGVEARIGEPYGAFFGQGFLRAPDGSIIYNAQGQPQIDPVRRVLGNFTPDWIGGIQNTFTYKNLSLSSLIDMKIGGDMFSQSVNIGRFTGVLAETVYGREDGIVGEGVVNVGTAENPNYVPNTIRLRADEWYHSYYSLTNNENTIFDASYVKLREVKLSYMISGKAFKKLPFRNIGLSLVGRNLLLLHSKIPHVDPESNFYNDGNLQGIENGQVPSTRSYGFNVNFGI
jgi:TonB-linked SusC/RagA family outer membrane protein